MLQLSKCNSDYFHMNSSSVIKQITELAVLRPIICKLCFVFIVNSFRSLE